MASAFSEHELHTAEGTRISYDKGKNGRRPALVFLHGLGGTKEAWGEIREALEQKGWGTLALDLQGHGASSRPRAKTGYAVEQLSSSVIQVVKQEGLVRPVLVGHCLGGMVALHAAASFPAMFSGLVLVATGTELAKGGGLGRQTAIQRLLSFGTNRLPSLHKKGARDFSRFQGTGTYDAKRLLADVLYTSPATYLACLQAMTRFQGAPLLSALDMPVLLVAGGKDPLFPPRRMARMKAGVDRASFLVIKGANHIVPLNNPGQLTRAVASWLLSWH